MGSLAKTCVCDMVGHVSLNLKNKSYITSYSLPKRFHLCEAVF